MSQRISRRYFFFGSLHDYFFGTLLAGAVPPGGFGNAQSLKACPWFVHGDSRPEAGALEAIGTALRSSSAIGGNFSLVFEGQHYSAGQMTAIYPTCDLLA